MNLFIKGPHEDHYVTCAGCDKNVFFSKTITHHGTHWCMDCHRHGKHMQHGPGFGPIRFSGETGDSHLYGKHTKGQY